MLVVKIHTTYRNVVAICDHSLLGKRLEDEKRQLELRESFFGGEPKTRDEVAEIMRAQAKEDATFNIAGKEATQLAQELGIIDKEGISKIQGVPFALVLL